MNRKEIKTQQAIQIIFFQLKLNYQGFLLFHYTGDMLNCNLFKVVGKKMYMSGEPTC